MMLPNGGYAAASKLDRIVSFLILILVAWLKAVKGSGCPRRSLNTGGTGIAFRTGLVWLLTGYHAEIE